MRSVRKEEPYDEDTLQQIKTAASASELEVSLKSMLILLTRDRKLKEVFKMYTYFRDHQPEERENFKFLHSILTKPVLDELWGQILRRENGSKAFRGAPAYKNHRLDNQPEDTPDLRHPFFVLAGGYYYCRSTKRDPAFSAENIATPYMNANQFNKALKAFEKEFSRFKPRDEIEEDCQKIILEKIENLKTLGDLNNVDSDEAVSEAFKNIQEQIAVLRKIHFKELEAGMKYRCIRCYTAAQYLDLQTVNIHINLKTDLFRSDVIELFSRIENRAENVEKNHYTVGALLANKSYLRIAEAFRAKTQLIEEAISQHRFFTIQKPCGFSVENAPLANDQRLQKLHAVYQQGQITYFNKALNSLYNAESLEADGNDTALTHNATGGKELSNLRLHYLKYKNLAYENVSALRKHVEHEIKVLCPAVAGNYDGGDADKENENETSAVVTASSLA